MAHVFIIHADEDRSFVEKLKMGLDHWGCHVSGHGATHVETESGDVLVYVYSEAARDSAVLSAELTTIQKAERPFVPILSGDMAPGTLVTTLARLGYIDFTDPAQFSLRLKQLVASIHYPEYSVKIHRHTRRVLSDQSDLLVDQTASTMETSAQRPAGAVRIFISHAAANDRFVNRLVIDLERSGYRTWVDHWPEFNTIASRDDALAQCDIMVLVVSEASLEEQSSSETEWRKFYQSERFIIPVLLGTVRPPSTLLKMVQNVRFERDYEQEYYIKLQNLLRLLYLYTEDIAHPSTEDGMISPEVAVFSSTTGAEAASKTIDLSTHGESSLKKLEAQTSSLNFRGVIGDQQLLIVFPQVDRSYLFDLNRPLIVGRQHEALEPPDIDLTPFNPLEYGISRRHARLEFADKRVTITDLNSANGTYLGRKRLEPQVVTPLKNKSIVQFGMLMAQVFFKDDEPPHPYKYHIFLSYSHQDGEIMQQVRASFQKINLSVWAAEENLEPGTRSWRRAIEQAIEAAGCLVVILSPDAKESKWVEAEVDYAESHGKTIFMILARGDRRTAVPFGWNLVQWVDIQQDYNQAMEKLSVAITKHLDLD